MAEIRLSEGFALFENVTGNKTLAVTHQGLVQNVVADGAVITLPATVVGVTFTVRVGGVPAGGPVGSGSNKSVGLAISPNADDRIDGLGATGVDNKDLLLAKATSKVGDYVTLVGTTNGWNIAAASGVFTREP